MLRVNNIYPAFMGEVNCHGIGAPCTFVRLAGCNLTCYFHTKGTLCDTPEALSIASGKPMSEAEILSAIDTRWSNIICLTGGEPLMQNVRDFLMMASAKGLSVVIETNGSMPIDKYGGIKGVSFVVDRKSASSGELSRMLADNYLAMGKYDYLKFVIDTEDDYNEALEFYRTNRESARYNFAVGTFWGSKVSYSWLMNRMHLDNFKAYLNMQTHKMSVLYDKNNENEGVSSIKIPKNL